MSVLLKDQWIYTFGPFVLDPSRRVLTRAGTPLALSKKSFDLLLYLVENPHRVVGKDELFDAIWPGRVVEESNLSQTVFTLRKTLGAGDAGESVIATSPGRGYRIDVPVHAITRNTDVAETRVALDALVAANSPEPASVNSEIHSANDGDVKGGPKTVAGKSRRWRIFATAGLFLIVVIVFALMQRTRNADAPTTSKTIVLADFDNATGDGTFDSVLGRVLEIDLSQSPFLTILPPKKVQETLQEMGRPKDDKLTASVAQEVCERNQAQAAISGALAMLGNRYVVTVAANDCSSGNHIVEGKAEASTKEAILPAIDDLTARIRAGVGETKISVQKFAVPLAQATTTSFDALKAFSLGLQARAKGDDAGALAFHKQAIDLDPSFAMAYIELGVIHRSRHEQAIGNAYLKKAYEFRDKVGEHEKMRIAALYELSLDNTLGMIEAYKAWTRMYPQDWPPWANLTNVYTDLGEYSEAIEAGKEAVRLMPEHGGTYFVLARAYTRASQFDQAKAICAAATAKGLDGWDIHSLLFEIAFAQDDTTTMSAQLAKESGEADDERVLATEGFAAAASGKEKQARALFERAIADARKEGADSIATVGGFFVDEIDVTANSGSRQDALQIAAHADGLDSNEFAPITLAKAGDVDRANAMAIEMAKRSPADTTAIDIDIPATRAAIDLQNGLPKKAIDDLQPALAYEFRNFEVPSLLAQAYLDAKMPERAADEYQKILSHRGVDALSILFPLAHLGLARAEAQMGNKSASRAEYARFFDVWKEADADLPILVEAKAESAKLLESN